MPENETSVNCFSVSELEPLVVTEPESTCVKGTAGLVGCFLTLTFFIPRPAQIQVHAPFFLESLLTHYSSVAPPTYFSSHKQDAQPLCLHLKSGISVQSQQEDLNTQFTYCHCFKSKAGMLGLFMYPSVCLTSH